ncbi:MAG: hypothetical protein DLM66_12775 [Candidatus Dormiibacter spiritus]|nr:MAG: hypothetical protein DLM66_12775 [Candidatus Dormibacteraeota bacterium]
MRPQIGVPMWQQYRAAYETMRLHLQEGLGDEFPRAWSASQATDQYTALDSALRIGDPGR